MEDAWDAPPSWEEFFGGSSATDLVPTLLHMYDSLACGTTSPTGEPPAQQRPPAAPSPRPPDPPPPPQRPVAPPPPPPVEAGKPPRPLSAASSCSSSSSSGETGAPSAVNYLASTESLEACSSEEDDDEGVRVHVAARRRSGRLGQALREGSALLHRQSGSSAGSADSGVGGCNHISAPCPPPARPRYCDPHLSYMDRVVMEIVETEAVYVRDLTDVVQGYLHMWRVSPECAIEPQHLADLFSNMEAILGFNSGFLSELEKCGLDPVSVARCFVSHTSGFRIYTEYCTSYPRTVSVLTELMRRETTVKLCRERQLALRHSLPLGSFLLKPVQRILKYHLLLQNIVKQYCGDAEGAAVIEEALAAMTSLAQHINEMKRRHEHAVRVQEIQSLLLDWQGADLTTFGELCAEGTFRMCGAKALRHAFLFDKMLLIAKRAGDALSCKTHIECSNLMLIESIPGEPLSFHVIPFDNPRMQYTFQARSLEQKREWSQQLKRVILENYSAVIPSHARQLVMQLGQGRSEDELLAERATPRRQHSAPQYLQRRQQERRRSETGLLPSRLRRSRRSDAGLPGQREVSPNSPRRGQRSASASREPGSETAAATASPATALTASTEKLKDRFYSWHRKSEPYCSLTLPSKLSQLFSSERRSSASIPASESQPAELHEEQPQPSEAPDPPEYPATAEEDEEEEEAQEASTEEQQRREASVEEIVGELVLQNMKRPLRRSRSAGRPRDPAGSTTTAADSSSDTEQQSPRQRLRAQRLARMCALRQQQENLQRLDREEKPSTFLQKWQRENNIITNLEPPAEPEPPQQQQQQEDTKSEEAPDSPTPSHPEGHRGSLFGVLASLGSRLRVNSSETLTDMETPHGAAMYKQGSPGLGARLAHNNSEYADPQTLFKTRPEPEDSFYEKSLAAVLDEEEAFRDSAIFSDEHEEEAPRVIKVPPPIPAKPKQLQKGTAVWRTMEAPRPHFPRLKHSIAADCEVIKAPNGFRAWNSHKTSSSADDLLMETRNKPRSPMKASSSSTNCASERCADVQEEEEEAVKPRGWVKQVVGRLQASATEPTSLPFSST